MPRQISGSWISHYMNYMSDSESPKSYLMWVAMSAIGAVCKRNVFYEHGTIKHFPNQYIVLVGPPGVGKGAAINPLVDLVKETKLANYLPDRITAEKIIEKMAKGFQIAQAINGAVQLVQDSCATIISTELPIFLGSSDWMLPFLCDMWDNKGFEYDTKHRGNNIIKDSSLGLLGGCVPDYIRKLNKDVTASVTSGFSARTVFVHASKPSQRVPFPVKMSTRLKQKDELMHDLAVIATTKGDFSFSKGARVLWEMLYKQNTAQAFETEVVANFRSRMMTHTLKVAMAQSLSQNDTLVIDEVHLINAHKLVEGILNTLDIVFRAVGESPLAAAQGRIMDFLETKGRASRSEILKYNARHVTSEDLDRILYVLEQIGKIDRANQGQSCIYTWKG